MAALSDTPQFSTIRVIYDLTEGRFPVFQHALAVNLGLATGFTYGQREPGGEAGFSSDTSNFLTQKRTSLINKGKLPGDAEGLFGRIAFEFGPLKKPIAMAGAAVVTCTASQAQSADPSQFVPISDATGLVATTAFRLFCEAYAPFLQYGADGTKEYFPSAKMLSSGKEIWDGHSGVVMSQPYEFATPRVWAPSGDKANLRVGIEPLVKVVTQAYGEMAADSAGSLGPLLRAAAQYPALGVAPTGAGQFVLVQDVGIWLYGATRAQSIR